MLLQTREKKSIKTKKKTTFLANETTKHFYSKDICSSKAEILKL
jgi:hypothetical protein